MDAPTNVGDETGQAPAAPLSLMELGAVLVRHYALTEGYFDVSVEFQIGVGAVGVSPENVVPSAIIGVSRIGLIKTTKDKARPTTIDASQASSSPKKSPRSRAKTPK